MTILTEFSKDPELSTAGPARVKTLRPSTTQITLKSIVTESFFKIYNQIDMTEVVKRMRGSEEIVRFYICW